MDTKEFSAIYRTMKDTAKMNDALLQDARAGTKGTRDVLRETSALLQAQLIDLIREHELTKEQIESLPGITFCTPGWPDAKDCQVDHFSVIKPFGGSFTGADQALGKFSANLLGFGAYRVQGTKSEYFPVRLERPK